MPVKTKQTVQSRRVNTTKDAIICYNAKDLRKYFNIENQPFRIFFFLSKSLRGVIVGLNLSCSRNRVTISFRNKKGYYYVVAI